MFDKLKNIWIGIGKYERIIYCLGFLAMITLIVGSILKSQQVVISGVGVIVICIVLRQVFKGKFKGGKT